MDRNDFGDKFDDIFVRKVMEGSSDQTEHLDEKIKASIKNKNYNLEK